LLYIGLVRPPALGPLKDLPLQRRPGGAPPFSRRLGPTQDPTELGGGGGGRRCDGICAGPHMPTPPALPRRWDHAARACRGGLSHRRSSSRQARPTPLLCWPCLALASMSPGQRGGRIGEDGATGHYSSIHHHGALSATRCPLLTLSLPSYMLPLRQGAPPAPHTLI
jgi:hypothetical protein